MKSLHIICAKCGSTDIKVRVDYSDVEGSGVTFHCLDCATTTDADEIQEQLDVDNKRRRICNDQ